VRLTFLGTGTSFGIPVVACGCPTCTSHDFRDQRTRHGAHLALEDGGLLIDTPPELRLQLLATGIDRVDAVWFTHQHADHLHGIDDLRLFSAIRGRRMIAYAPEGCEEELLRRFPYIFDETIRAPAGTTVPEIHLETVRPDVPVQILGKAFVPVVVPHGATTVFGFRVGPLGYVTDAKRLPPAALEALSGVEVLVLNALWFGHPHPSHFNVEEAVAAAARVGARRTLLTHLTHEVGHQELIERLPKGVEPAYDGLVIDIPED
jgi:phosphoribosyl 1,2-cyclic phosphate phosphodiesterase